MNITGGGRPQYPKSRKNRKNRKKHYFYNEKIGKIEPIENDEDGKKEKLNITGGRIQFFIFFLFLLLYPTNFSYFFV